MTDEPTPPLFGEDWLAALLPAMLEEHCGGHSPEKERQLQAGQATYPSREAFADHSVATGKPPGKKPKQHDLSGWYKLALQYGLPDEPGVAQNIDVLNELHFTHSTRYPQHPANPIPDASIIAGSTVEHLISTFTRSINPR